MRLTVVIIFSLIGAFSLYAADTELTHFRPFGDDNPTVPLLIQEKHSGQCWQQSQRIKREDAWRCSADNKTYDPCFVKPHGLHDQAICPESPWVGASVQLDLPQGVNNIAHTPLDLSRTYPWAVALTNGSKCQALDEGNMFDNQPIHYQCDNQTLLFGPLQRCKMPWTTLQRDTDGKVTTVAIAKAWF